MAKSASPCDKPSEILSCSGLKRDGVQVTEPHFALSDEFPHVKKYHEAGNKRCRNYLCKPCLRVSNKLHRESIDKYLEEHGPAVTARCIRCEEQLPASSFGRDPSRKTGLTPYCKPCDKIARPYVYHDSRKRSNHKRRALKNNAEQGCWYAREEYIRLLKNDPCVYCNGSGGSLEHIIPLIKNGSDSWNNFASACRNCNSSKTHLDLLDFMLRKI